MDIIPSKEIEAVRELFLPIGHIVIQWAYVDSNLGLCLKIISDHYDTKNIINNKNISNLTKRKIDLFKECLEQLPSLAFLKKDGLILLKTALDISKIRNIIIHGTYGGLNSDGSYNFQRLVFKKKKKEYIIEKYPYTLSGLNHLGKMIRDLASDIGYFGIRLHSDKDIP